MPTPCNARSKTMTSKFGIHGNVVIVPADNIVYKNNMMCELTFVCTVREENVLVCSSCLQMVWKLFFNLHIWMQFDRQLQSSWGNIGELI